MPLSEASPSIQPLNQKRRLDGRLQLLAALSMVVATLFTGCDLSYYARAAYEEGRLLWNRRPIEQVLQKPDLSPTVRQRLQTVLAVREFAADHLALSVGGAYTTVTPVDQNAIVWVVMAAPRDSLTPYLWWFPVVGYVPYKGYFSKARAEAEARAMEQKGFDVFMRPAVAFSSLGFFNDPLLSNLLELNRVELAGVLIHELFHRTFFLKSDVMFDESSANWIGTRGAIDFFTEARGANSAEAVAARQIYDSDMKFAAFLLLQEARLRKLYQSGLPLDQLLRRRQAVFTQINADYARLKPLLSGLERFDLDEQPLNNAVLLNYMIYFHSFSHFAALERVYRGNTRATIQAIIELARSQPEDPFHALWKVTLNAPPVRDEPELPNVEPTGRANSPLQLGHG
jgi:predicted aminopeptidase